MGVRDWVWHGRPARDHAQEEHATFKCANGSRQPLTLMITFQISGYLIEFTGGQAEIKVEDQAGTVGEALQVLWNRHVGLRDRVLTERGEVRPHVNVFVDGQVTRRDQALQTSITDESEICIMPAVSGG